MSTVNRKHIAHDKPISGDEPLIGTVGQIGINDYQLVKVPTLDAEIYEKREVALGVVKKLLVPPYGDSFRADPREIQDGSLFLL